MNLFILDNDPDKNAEYHIDKHVGKMQLEAAQLLATTLWIDKLLGFIPRKLNSDELGILRAEMANLPPIEERTFVRYKAMSPNHPCAIWVRSSLSNYIWTQVYVQTLNDETIWRGNKSHASCAEVLRMGDPTRLPDMGLTPFAQAMPDAYKNVDAVHAYRTYYRMDKAAISSWKKRGEPDWWDTIATITKTNENVKVK